MEAANIISALAELGTLGAVVIGGLGVWFVVQRSRKNGNGAANQFIELLGRREDSLQEMVRTQQSLVSMQEQIVKGQSRIADRIDRLVEIHIKTEPTIERLERIMEERR